MIFKIHISIRTVGSILILALLGLTAISTTVAIDPPQIIVNPIWRPANQLDTVDNATIGVTDAGDDLRYVDVEIYVTSSVQFWAAEFTCTVDKTVLENYIPFNDTGLDPSPDDVSPVTFGAEWSSAGGLSQNIVSNTTNLDGKVNFAAARLGTASPIGGNGIKKTFLLATVRYRVKDLAANKTSPFTCTSAFLNKDGKSVLAPTFTAPPVLSVITGYNINGKIIYQGQTNHSGIAVECIDGMGGTWAAPATPATGIFSISGLRILGTYDCYFYGSKINPDKVAEDVHLTARTSFNVNSATYNLLPVVLRAGNVNRDASFIIDFNDIVVVTANWNTTSAAYDLGDANGDSKIDKSDLALVSGNLFGVGLSEEVNTSHLIYSLPRDNDRFMNSHIWLGNYYGEASIAPFVTGTQRDYWATLSPDGAKIAFIRNIGVGNADKFALFTAPVTAGVVGAATNITLNVPFDAFAPSWSPDGATLAFVCSYNRADWTNGSGRGNLCLINSNGSSLQQKIALPASNEMVNIHPPAWYSNSALMYGGPDWFGILASLPTCNNRICRLDLIGTNPSTRNTTESNLAVGSDMPTIRRGSMGAVLFYRQSLGLANDVIRFAELDELAPVPSIAQTYGCGNLIGFKHCDVVTGAGFNQVGYFNVYSGNNDSDFNQYGIVFYDQDENTSSGGGFNYTLLDWNGTAASPTWQKVYSSYSPSNVVGNPNITVTDADPLTEGYLALRNTVEWTP
jgi:hypothetical protein